MGDANTEQEPADIVKVTSNHEQINPDGCPDNRAVDEKTVISEPDTTPSNNANVSCPDIPIKIEPETQERECTLMEYRSLGVDGKDSPSDADSEDSSTSSDSSSDGEDNDTADTKINKAMSHGRDVSPEEIKRVKLNRFGFEDIRTKGELLPEDLPPLEELTITVDEKVDMMYVGKITSVVGVLVIIQSGSEVPPLNDDTILFLEGHKVLGQVFEIFGPVKTPWYSVRFNDPENIKTKEITVGLSVYCAPKEECFTKYVFVDSLKQMKGSDASWEDNNEPPEKYVDYSDDEAERQAKAKKKNKRQNHDGENGGENIEKKSKNDYNHRERQSQFERPTRGHHDGGNPRFSRARGRGGNPFQGQNQAPLRPRFASSGPANQGDARWNSNNRFNCPRWQGNVQNRNNNFSDRNGAEFTAERLPNFGGPPRFSSGPQFNGNMPRSQGPPQQRHCFGNRMMHNGQDHSNNWNQHNQNVFGNNRGQRFTPSPVSSPQQSMSPMPNQEGNPTPPPPPPPSVPSHPSASQFTPIQTQPNVFTSAPGTNGISQRQLFTVPTGFPPNMTQNMPRNMTNMPQNMNNMPPNMTNMPPNMTNISPDMTNMPLNMNNMPPNMTNMAPNMTNISPNMSPNMNMMSNQGPSFTALAAQSQPNVMGDQLCPVPANMVPPNAMVYIPVSQIAAAQSITGLGQNFGATLSTQMMGSFSNNNQSQSINTGTSGQFNPYVPPPQINSSQSGNTCLPPPQSSSHIPPLQSSSQNGSQCAPQPQTNDFQNGVSTSNAPAQPSNMIVGGAMYNNGGEQTYNSSSYSSQSAGMIDSSNNNPQMKPYRQSKNISEMLPGNQQTGQQQNLNNTALEGAGTQPTVLQQKQTQGPASQTLPFQDAKFLHNMISAGMGQGRSAPIVDRRLMQND